MSALTLAAGLRALGIEHAIDAATQQRLLAFGALLLKWNKVYNLTALRTPEQVLSHHLLDSLAVLPHVPEGEGVLVDVGSGGGLPGIVLAIARPTLAVVSVEAVSKKVSFQQQAKIELGLANFTPRAARIEQVTRADLPLATGDTPVWVISRAFASLADFVSLAGHLAQPAGALLAMKGVLPGDEIAALPPDWRVMQSWPLQVPGLDAERHLLRLAPSA